MLTSYYSTATATATTILVFLLLIVLSSTVAGRRILHQPFFPLDSSSSVPPTSPKYPFSTSTPITTPFFPSYPSPPPPPTFPANVDLPPQHHSTSAKLIGGAVAAVIVAVAIVSVAFFLHRKHRSPPNSKSQRSHTSSTAQAPKPPSQTSSEFLYLGTLANSHNNNNHNNNGSISTSTSTSNNTNVISRKMDSPELRPLPPLHRNHNGDEASSKDDEDQAFYSIGTTSASTRAIQVETFNRTSTSSSSSSNSSSTCSPPSPARSISSTLSSTNSIPQSPDLIEIQTTLHMPTQSASDIYSRTSQGSSPSNSNVSDRQLKINHNVRAIPPPPPPPPPLQLSKVWQPPKTQTPPCKKPVFEPVKPIAVESPNVVSPFKLRTSDSEADGNKGGQEETTLKPKLKPLHWDKVRASSDREMVWDQLKCSSFKLNEEMIESLFVANTAKPTPKEANRWQVLPSPGDNGNRVLDPKKAQNIAIQLRALNVTVEEVCEGLLEGNAETLGTELLESLLKMAPTKEEERNLKEYKDVSPTKLGAAERFLKAVLDIPNAFKRIDAMLYVSNFESEVDYLKKSFETLEAACEELRTSRMFLKLLDAVLKTGNRMNVGTNRGDAHAFKLDTLLKLVDVKGTDGQTTLLHFVVQEIIRSEGARLTSGTTTENSAINDDAKCRKLGLQVVSSLSSELSNVKKAAGMDAEVLSSDVSKLSKGIGNVGEVVRLNEAISLGHNFSESMNSFMKKAEAEIIRIQAQESAALSLVKEITEYFHGNSAKEEARPFRIFMVVRDFLTILDRVCKEVGLINEPTMVSSAHKFPVPVNPMLQHVSGGFPNRHQYSSSDEEH